MPEWTSLYLVFCWLRSVEYLCWRQAGTVVFRGPPHRGCTPTPRGGTYEVGGAGLVLGNPLHPFGGMFRSGSACEGSLDPQGLSARLSVYRHSARPLLRAEAALGLHLFVVVPVVWTVLGIARTWPYLLGGVLVLHAMTVIAFLRAHSRVFESSRGDRWMAALQPLLAPPLATAGHVAITGGIARGAHPVAAAFVLCDDDAFREVASAFLRRVEFPVSSGADQADADPADTPPARLDELRALVSQRLGPLDTLLAHPGKRSDTARTYCPRCLAEYSNPEGTCSECEGVPLKHFA